MRENKNLKTAITAVNVSIFILTIITAGVHFYLASQPDEKLHFWFLLNGLGFLVLLAAFFLPSLKSFHNSIVWILFGYTLLTIILWFFLGSPREGVLDPFDMTIKAVEITLAIQLFLISKIRLSRP